jgi:DNA (cytosine-5)-methyltransferase 1
VTRPRLLDLFCGAGGAAMGYHRAGFDVVGVDIRPQPRYPFEFIEGDALDALTVISEVPIEQRHASWNFDAIHASPPCQFYASLSKGDHWRSIPPTREQLEQTGLPYVIENIADAGWDMRDPARLCGSMFGLSVRRHRLFETSFSVMAPTCHHGNHGRRIRAYYGKKGWVAWTPRGALVQGTTGSAVYHHRHRTSPLLRGSVDEAPGDMGIDWMTSWDELREAIPPAYTELIGHQLKQHLQAVAA